MPNEPAFGAAIPLPLDVEPLELLEPPPSIAAHTEDQRPFATSTVIKIPRQAKITPPSRTPLPGDLFYEREIVPEARDDEEDDNRTQRQIRHIQINPAN